MRAAAVWSLAGVLILWSAAGTAGQKPIQFRSSADTVEVHATVKLRNGTIARDLVKEDFTLLEDGKPVEITVFSKSIQPLSAALVLDHSGSTDAQFDDVKAAGLEFIGHLLRGDRAAVSSLNWDCHEFTDKMNQLQAVLKGMMPPDRGSPIWWGTDRAMDALANEGGRRVILLMTDGLDNQRQMLGVPPSALVPPISMTLMTPCEFVPAGDLRTAQDVMNRAEREAIMVYTVSVGAGAGELETIAKRTGAWYHRLSDYDELKGAFRSIADELHLQYVLGFTPSFTDGKSHKIEVKVKRSGVNVQARKGYVAGQR